MHNLLLGVVAYRASVEQYCIGSVNVIGGGVPGHAHDGSHDFTVGNVHLATISLYVYPVRSIFRGPEERFLHIFIEKSLCACALLANFAQNY